MSERELIASLDVDGLLSDLRADGITLTLDRERGIIIDQPYGVYVGGRRLWRMNELYDELRERLAEPEAPPRSGVAIAGAWGRLPNA